MCVDEYFIAVAKKSVASCRPGNDFLNKMRNKSFIRLFDGSCVRKTENLKDDIVDDNLKLHRKLH